MCCCDESQLIGSVSTQEKAAKVAVAEKSLKGPSREKRAIDQRIKLNASQDWANQSSNSNQNSFGRMHQNSNAFGSQSQLQSNKREDRDINQSHARVSGDQPKENQFSTWANESKTDSWGAPSVPDSDFSWGIQPQEESTSFNWGSESKDLSPTTESWEMNRDDSGWGSQSNDNSQFWNNSHQPKDNFKAKNNHPKSMHQPPSDSPSPFAKRERFVTESPLSSNQDSPVKDRIPCGSGGRPTRKFLASSAFDDSFDNGQSPKHFKKKEFTPKPFHSKKNSDYKRQDEGTKGQFKRNPIPPSDPSAARPQQKKNTSTESSSKVTWNW